MAKKLDSGGDDLGRRSLVGRLAWLPIPVLLAATLVLQKAGLPGSYESPHLLLALSFLFSALASLFVAYLVGRSFLVRGTPGLLLLGCGVVIWGAAGFAAVVASQAELGTAQRFANTGVTIYNLCVWLSALCHLTGVVLSLRPRPALPAAGLWLAVGYMLALGGVGLVVLSVHGGWMPTFFVQGQGGTLLRQLVLGSAVAMFGLTGILLGTTRRPLSSFAYWYALALGLIAVGLFGVSISSVHGGVLSWTGRATQLLGGLYMLVAAVVSVRDSHVWGISLEAALRETEERYRTLIETVPDAIVVHRDGRLLYANGAALTLTGARSFERLAQHTVLDFFRPHDRGRAVERMRVAAAGNALPVREATLARLDGQEIAVEFHTTPVDFQGAPAILTIIRDVTARKQAEEALRDAHEDVRARAEQLQTVNDMLRDKQAELEETNEYLREQEQELLETAKALRESQERLTVAASGTRIGMFDWDVVTGEVLWTEQIAHLLGLRPTTTTTTTSSSLSQTYHYHDWAERVHPEDRSRVQAELDRCMAGHMAYEVEYRVVWPDGSVHWVTSRGVFQYESDGPCTRMLGILMDITERKQAEEGLRESEEKFRLLAETSPAAILIYQDGTLVYLNPAIESITGYGRGQLLGKEWSSMIHPDYRQKAEELASQRAQGRGFPARYELRILTKDGQERWVDVSSVSILYGSRPAGLVVAFDITGRKHAEEAMQELNVTLEQKVAERTAELERRTRQLQKLALELSQAEDRERKRVAEILHEDLQQQIAGAKFHLSLLRGRVRRDPAQEALAARLDELLRDAIEKSRSLSHELSPAALHKNDLAEALRWLVNQLRERYGLAVRIDFCGEMTLESEALAVFLFRAAQELLFNVVQHAGINEAAVRVRRMGRVLCLSVSDRGCGFDPLELQETTGFGLFSLRERIELLGGRVRISGAEGKGSRFRIVVPDGLKAEARRQEPEDAGLGAEDGLPASSEILRVLLVDDHEIVRQGLASLLREMPEIEVVGEAANGWDAVSQADELRPDVVILDVSMSPMDGREAARQIKKLLPQVRIVALSMHEEPETIERMYEAGAESYVLKTAAPEELLAAIRGAGFVMKARHPRQERYYRRPD